MGKDCLGAFLVGGIICVIGQFFINYYTRLGLDKTDASTAASCPW
jgi:stage V sporulation protein AC